MTTPRRTRGRTLAGELAAGLRAIADGAGVGLWSSYRDRPVDFARDALGITSLWSKQREILQAFVEHDWLSVVSANAMSKSYTAALIANHFVETRPRATVIITSSKWSLIGEVVLAEMRRQRLGAPRPLGGELGLSPATGLRYADGRRVIGLTATDPEGFAGLRSPGGETLVIVDEASGISDPIFQAIVGILAGNGKLLLIGNALRASGFFYESQKSDRFRRFKLSAYDSPNVTGEMHIEGMATRQFIEDGLRLWGGETGPMFRIRCLGEFVEALEGRLFSPEMIILAEQRWETTPATGRLVIGCDPAGDGGDGDESAFIGRRGLKIVHLHTRRGLSPDAHVLELLGVIAENPGEGKALVVVDRDGTVGARVWGALTSYVEGHPNAFELEGIRGSEHAHRRPHEIHNRRDELWFNLVDAFREGLAIPGHVQLEGDLAAIRFDKLINGRSSIVKKPVIRRELGRSPDLGDALSLAAYEPRHAAAVMEPARAPRDIHEQARRNDQALNPYKWQDAYRPKRS